MNWLNYHHLRYFWVVAREGSLRKASERLRVSQPSISAQMKELQESLGQRLFRRNGAGLALTETGQLVYGYAEEIFGKGEELLAALSGAAVERELRLNVGLADALPKVVANEILKPLFESGRPIHVVCREGKVEDLLAQLATLRLDVVLADEPASTSLKFKTFNELLGSCGVTFYAANPLAATLRKGFPHSLNGAPALLPTHNTALRRSLEKWFFGRNISPHIVGEFEDAAMLTMVAADGRGFIPIAAVVGEEALDRYNLKVIGTTQQCTDTYYAITAERKVTHPALELLTRNAHSRLFASLRRHREARAKL